MARLIFHGAAQQVTGSMHLLEANGKLIALDCGLFQGRRRESRELNQRHPRPPRDIHAVVLSHAHIDHSGRLPMLVRDGFTGVIHTNAATRDLCAVMLADAAYIQEEDARHLNKHRDEDAEEVQPLYTSRDAVQAVKQMQASPYDRWFKVAHGVHARFFEAGHMLGSAGIEVEITDANGSKKILVFSGDVGRKGTPILRDPCPLPRCDYLICEATYGGRVTEAVEDAKLRLADVVSRTIARGGRVLIPAFSVGRTQTIVYYLRELFTSGQLKSVPVFIDSPLALNATDVFRLHPECYDRDARDFVSGNGGLLDGPQFHYIQTREESKRMMRRRASCIIVAASGMCEAGRIQHHLLHSASNSKNTILIVGFQAEHTLGRRIVESAPVLSIYRQHVKLNAEVAVLNGFSSHADANELRDHIKPIADTCRGVFLVHSEIDQSTALAEILRRSGSRDVQIPVMGEMHELR